MIAEVIPRIRGIRQLEILDYIVPGDLHIQPGMTVEVPFRSQTILGVVVKLKTTSDTKRLKSIQRIISEEASLSPLQIELIYHVSERTGAPLSTCLLTVVQSSNLGKNKKEVSVSDHADALGIARVSKQRLPLLKKTANRILIKKEPVVLHYDQAEELVGVTSLLASQAQPCLVLVPHEQALHWWESRLKHVQPVIYSSRNRLTQQREVLEAVRSGQAKVVIGTRGAIFLPPDHWQLILVVDEEHQSYHQDQNPRFQAVELAAWLAQRLRIPCVLTSLSPRVASSYQFSVLDISRPPTHPPRVLNLHDWWSSGQAGILTTEFIDWIHTHLPVVLMYNRKGEFLWLRCADCQHLSPLGTPECPQCHSLRLKPGGLGNQRVEQILQTVFPSLTVARWDADSSSPCPKADILLSTSFGISRIPWREYAGIGVVSVDHQLAIPDFRTNERTLGFLTQLIRTGLPLCIQTASPAHTVIQAASTQDYQQFYETELELRKKLQYPPFGQVVEYIETKTRKTQVRKFPFGSPLPQPADGSVLDILE